MIKEESRREAHASSPLQHVPRLASRTFKRSSAECRPARAARRSITDGPGTATLPVVQCTSTDVGWLENTYEHLLNVLYLKIAPELFTVIYCTVHHSSFIIYGKFILTILYCGSQSLAQSLAAYAVAIIMIVIASFYRYSLYCSTVLYCHVQRWNMNPRSDRELHFSLRNERVRSSPVFVSSDPGTQYRDTVLYLMVLSSPLRAAKGAKGGESNVPFSTPNLRSVGGRIT